MSKLAKALEKAQQVRDQLFDEERAEGAPGSEAQQARASQAPAGPVKPVYSQTRQKSVDSRLMERNRLLGGVDSPAVADSYSLLRGRLMEMTKTSGWNTIMVTSAVAGEGKTTTAINLAMSIARDVQRTALLVDTNLRHPAIGSLLGLDPCRGLTDYLMGEVPIEDLLINPGMDKLVVLPAGRPFNGSTEVLDSPRMEFLVRELKNRYPDRYVIFDCPHLLRMPDSFMFSSYVDCVVLVVEANKTAKTDVSEAMDMLESRNLLGLVMNKAH